MSVVNTGTADIHWNYFLALESDMERISRFIEFDTRNYRTFSIELAHLLFAASSEFEVVAKEVCLLKGSSPARLARMPLIKNEIIGYFPEISDENVLIPKHKLKLDTPLEKFKTAHLPKWWDAYNQVKHHRKSQFHLATLENTFMALGSLMIIVLYHKITETGEVDSKNSIIAGHFEPESSFFEFEKHRYHGW